MGSAVPAAGLIGSDTVRVALRGGDAEKPLRIAMMTNLFHPVATGSSTQVQGLAKALAALGHHVIVITAHVDSATPAHERMDGFEVLRIPALHLPKMAISLNFPWLNWTFWPKNLKRMETILREHRIDLLHVHNHMFDMAFAGRVLGRRLGLPVVVTLHTIIKHSIAAFNLILFPADRVFLRRAVVKHASAVICPDVNIQTYLREAFGRTDGTMIPYGISLPIHPGTEVTREIVDKFSLKGRRVILSLGHVHALRNRLDLIRALPQVRERFPDVLLLIVGSVGDQRPVDLVKQLNLEDTVIFAGTQPHAHVPVYHEIAELEAMWFDQADGGKNPLGIACMEAMLAGKPVLTVSNEMTFGPGVLIDGGNVLLVKAREADRLASILIDLLDGPQKSASIGDAARNIAQKHFAWATVANSTVKLYRKLIRKEPALSGPAVFSKQVGG